VPLAVWRFNIDKGNLNADESDALSMERNDEELKWWDHIDLTKLILASNKIQLITKEIKYLNSLVNLDVNNLWSIFNIFSFQILSYFCNNSSCMTIK